MPIAMEHKKKVGWNYFNKKEHDCRSKSSPKEVSSASEKRH